MVEKKTGKRIALATNKVLFCRTTDTTTTGHWLGKSQSIMNIGRDWENKMKGCDKKIKKGYGCATQ